MTEKNKCFCSEHSEHIKLLTENKSDLTWIKKIVSIIAMCVIFPLCYDGIKYIAKTFIKNVSATEVQNVGK